MYLVKLIINKKSLISHCCFTIAYSDVIWYVSMHTTKALGWCYGRLSCVMSRVWGVIRSGAFFVAIKCITTIHGHHHMCRRRVACSSPGWAVNACGCCSNGWVPMLSLWLLFHASVVRCDWKLKFRILYSGGGRCSSCLIRLPLWIRFWTNYMSITTLVGTYLFY